MPFRVARCWAMEVPITYEGAESAGSSFCWKFWKVHSSWCRSKSRRLDVIGQTTDGAFFLDSAFGCTDTPGCIYLDRIKRLLDGFAIKKVWQPQWLS